ncbi:BTB/POZ domain-containing protein [Ditylenchus destructor]|uniref:BTB/POZ domain-containing protein n=1 Tax=Ditylenchus destructor TaxID=166010 RepID=A0AAD4MLK9_9BILA|nr:BTB/POZ domain-containing protein [Ditylenchus destructor]
MAENDAIPNNNWVRLNVGGRIFQTTKDTLSQYPDSFLARLINGGLPSQKDESDAYLLDNDPDYFRIILNYLRRGVLNLDDSKLTMKGLLAEADFYNIKPLADEIRMEIGSTSFWENVERSDGTMTNTMSPATNRLETVVLHVTSDKMHTFSYIECSEKHDGYEVLQAFREEYDDQEAWNGRYYLWSKPRDDSESSGRLHATEKCILKDVGSILRSFGFVQESHNTEFEEEGILDKTWKFVRTVSK